MDRVWNDLRFRRDFLLLGLPPVRIPEDTGRRLDAEVVFVVTSTVRPTQETFSYGLPRSAFTPEERFEQTLATIGSIRRCVPGAEILLVDNSPLTPGERGILSDQVERFLELAAYPRAAGLRDTLSKAAAEAYMILFALGILERSTFKLLIKLSARYELTDDFDLHRFPRDRFVFRRVFFKPTWRHRFGIRRFLYPRGWRSAILYTVPRPLLRDYERILRRALRGGLRGICFEEALVRWTPPGLDVDLDRLGVVGRYAPTGRLIRH
jgi:hypothetical protein